MIHYARKQRQLKNLARRIADEVAANGGALTRRAAQWMRQLRRMFNALQGCISGASLRRLAVGLGFILSVQATKAQSFAPSIVDPHGLGGSEEMPILEFDLVDLDADGDLDLVGRTYSYADGLRLAFQENTGTPQAASFAPVSTPFGAQDMEGFDAFYLVGGNALAVADLDGDGDFDVLTVDALGYGGSYDPYVYVNEFWPVTFFENSGAPQAPEFNSGILNPFGLAFAPFASSGLNVQSIALHDLDGDGDLDLLGSTSQFSFGGASPICSFFSCENSGTPQAPQFEEPVDGAFGLAATPMPFEAAEAQGRVMSMDFVDFDADGDGDLMVSTVGSMSDIYNVATDLQFYENVGSATAPDFGEPPVVSPYGLEMTQATDRYAVKFADIDADGDDDAFINKALAIQPAPYEMNFQENTSPVSVFDVDRPAPASAFLWPNALRAGDPIEIHWPGDPAHRICCEFRDQAGRQIQALQLGSSSVHVPSQLAPGQYVVVLRDELTGQAFTDRLIVLGR